MSRNDSQQHEEDTIAELIHSFPAALAFENDNGQTPMESILEIDENSMLDCNHSIKFIPLIVQGAMRHDIVEDDDLGGGLFKKYLRNNSLSDATSSPIALAAVTTPSFLNTGFKFDNFSTVVSGFGCSSVSTTFSPFRLFTSIGAISCSNIPLVLASAQVC